MRCRPDEGKKDGKKCFDILPVLPDVRIALSSKKRLLGKTSDQNADRRDQIIRTIGNLTLLTQPLNSSLQNDPGATMALKS